MQDGGIDADQWDCGFCKENRIDVDRNCNGKHKPCPIPVFEEIFDQCPVSKLNTEACEILSIVEACEGGGFGGGSILPSQFMEETAYFHNVRRVILNARWKVDKAKKKKNKDK